MKDSEEIPPRVDLFARLICLAIGSVLGISTFYAFASNSLGVVFWLLGIAAVATLVAGIFGPRSPHIGLVGWLPWF